LKTLKHIEKDEGVVLDGSNLIFEIYKAKVEKKFEGGHHQNLTFSHQKETDSVGSSLKGNVFYAVRGRRNGLPVKICGNHHQGECNMQQFVDFLWRKVSRMRADKCEREIERIEAEQLWTFLTWVIVILLGFVLYYGYFLG
jgi:hypothetical protein